MTQRTLHTLAAATIAAIAACAGSLAIPPIVFEHAGRIAAGVHTYDGGRLTLVPVSNGKMLALRIDGRPVALYFVEGERLASPAEARVVLSRRPDGTYELAALRDRDGREVRLRLATAAALRPNGAPAPVIAQRKAETDTRPTVDVEK